MPGLGPLRYLIFDASEGDDGQGSWEAMASVRDIDRATRLPAVLAEARAVLDWAEAHAPGPRGPIEDGGHWDAELDIHDDGDWIRVTLTLSGPLGWGEPLRADAGE
jgi:hypothetical protein